MRRREFLGFVGGAAAWPIAAHAQQPAIPVIGFLYGGRSGDLALQFPSFRQGLRQAGYIEGHNVAIEYRWAEYQYDRLPKLAEDLVRRRVDVIIAIGGGGLVATTAKTATATIPIVFTSNLDPVKSGLVATLNRPGGNATGMSFFGSLLEPKKLELLHDVIAKAAPIAMLTNPKNPNAEADATAVQAAAHPLGRPVSFVSASTENEIEAAFATMARQQARGLIVAADPFFNSRREQLVSLATQSKLGAIFEWREFVEAGGLMSYGSSLTDVWRRVGVYAGRILKGKKPADLPVQQPAKFELVINFKVAKALGIELPTALLVRADEVIE
jgi:putative ABC transport system substrate-binding protein